MATFHEVNGRTYKIEFDGEYYTVSSDKMKCHDNGQEWTASFKTMEEVAEFMDVNSNKI